LLCATDGINGIELWKYDGATASLVTNLNPGSSSSSPSSLKEYNGYLYFSAIVPNGTRELWRYDGSGVSLFADIHTGSEGSFPSGGAVFNDAYYFSAYSSNGTAMYLYKYDGTNASIVSTARYPQSGSGLAVFRGALHFAYSDTLWKYDGTNFTSVGYSFNGSFSEFTVFNGALYFSGSDSSAGRELWRYDGTNMARIADLYPGSNGSSPGSFRVFNGRLFFMATTNGTQYGLWQYDGTNATRAGTIVLYSQNNLLIYNGALYFSASTNGADFEPWRYDGTNFSFVAQIDANHTNAGAIFWTTNQGAAFFSASDGLSGTQLWKYDGTNVTRITDFNPGGGYWGFTFNDAVYFMADDGRSGYEFWKYDGVTVSLPADINPGAATATTPSPLGQFRNMYLMAADDGWRGNELWRIDPTAELLRITDISRQGDDLSVTWQTPGGFTNVVQAANGDASGGVTNNFSDCSPLIAANQGDLTTTNFLDVGAATNSAARYYRIRLAP
jgi:ELWxxDGT repeat protein